MLLSYILWYFGRSPLEPQPFSESLPGQFYLALALDATNKHTQIHRHTYTKNPGQKNDHRNATEKAAGKKDTLMEM